MSAYVSSKKSCVFCKVLNIALFVSFVVTNLVPLTGVHIHKIASIIFLLLCIIHTVVYRQKLNGKRTAMLVTIVISFFSGLFGMILEQIPVIRMLHKVISIGCVFFLAIHIFVFQRGLRLSRGVNKNDD